MLALADRWLGRYTRALDMLSGLCLAIMVVLVFGNVVLRYTMNSGITVSEELSRWLFVWLTFMGTWVPMCWCPACLRRAKKSAWFWRRSPCCMSPGCCSRAAGRRW